MRDSDELPLAERVSSGIVLGCCIAGVLLFASCLMASFFGRSWPDGAFYLLQDNIAARISQSMSLGGIEYFTLDAWGFVPLAVLYAVFRIKRPAWVGKAILPASVVAFAPGIWSHLYYMPLHGCIYLTASSYPLENSAVLLIAMLTALALALFVWLRNRRLG